MHTQTHACQKDPKPLIRKFFKHSCNPQMVSSSYSKTEWPKYRFKCLHKKCSHLKLAQISYTHILDSGWFFFFLKDQKRDMQLIEDSLFSVLQHFGTEESLLKSDILLRFDHIDTEIIFVAWLVQLRIYKMCVWELCLRYSSRNLRFT